ncbi:hypothetical protein [Bradyrhizobium sp. ORS 86]|uniref:hypothetical protein n=1 Tax=Bradyrhizobium sp. ORS 86 TaxID=1685970 RepID=UPI00388FC5AF
MDREDEANSQQHAHGCQQDIYNQHESPAVAPCRVSKSTMRAKVPGCPTGTLRWANERSISNPATSCARFAWI